MSANASIGKRVLVTGGAGFIGVAVVRALTRSGHKAAVLDNLDIGTRERLAEFDLDFIEGNILDSGAVHEAVSGAAYVIHLAAQTGVPGSVANPRNDCQTNVLGTLNLLEACREHNVNRFIYASSNAVLGAAASLASEDTVPKPVSPYGASKLAGEAYCSAYRGAYGVESVVLRFSNVYGPFADHKSSVIPTFIRSMSSEKELTIHGDGEQIRDFLYVEDLAEAVLRALEYPCAGEVFQLGSGVPTSILALVGILQKIAGNNLPVRHAPSRPGDIKTSRVDISKTRRLLDWEPRTSLYEGLTKTCAWFDANIREDGS